MIIKNTNDGSANLPSLRIDINYGTCEELPDFSIGPKGDDREKHEAIAKAGFGGIQDGNPELCKEFNLQMTAHARVNKVGDLKDLLPVWKSLNYNCATVHLGWGMESDQEMDGLVNYIQESSLEYDFPIYIETHRATITQDMFRTVEMVKRFPEIRFNGDFSHWYTGQEMVYGGIENKWEFIAPVFDRVRFIHGRIGNPGSIQVDVNDEENLSYVEHFKEMWTKSFVGFLKTAQPGDYICFTVELLKSDIFYARTIKTENKGQQEEGDRWQQALLYKEIIKECWEKAVLV
ncbi:MAG: hypothetical protein KA133_11410 [Flavobacterium sp.]|uniref:hypothetical protein n=1 Tax=Flavobacterium sp. TaxID=239 RepID=UPI001B436DB8|nr:hypothetical protein [Flavobacterium sp.]MBP6183222.1 hypothetical protein [Flavobacterium sp.]MBP6759850.1 hypothetical protein [Flavobacterium sp.]